MKNFFEKIKNLLKASSYYIIFAVIFICGSWGFAQLLEIAENKNEYHKYTSYEIYEETNRLVYDSIKLSLIEQVNSYMQSTSKNTALEGLVVVNNCIKYDVDICFVLAQGEIESHFGTCGLARKTNSVFNVFAYDDKSYNEINKNGKYRHPNDCVEPYLKLLKNNYLVDGKTEYDMLNKYVNKHGKRYASACDYEEKLHSKMNKICETTNIYNSYQALKKQALILGIN